MKQIVFYGLNGLIHQFGPVVHMMNDKPVRKFGLNGLQPRADRTGHLAGVFIGQHDGAAQHRLLAVKCRGPGADGMPDGNLREIANEHRTHSGGEVDR